MTEVKNTVAVSVHRRPVTYDKTLPVVTVVTVVYNGAAALRKTAQSVSALTYGNVEYIVVDGASKDNTLEVIREHADTITCWMSEPDKGIYDAMNKAIDLATGDWVVFMNAGDTFASADVLDFFRERQDADLVYGDAVIAYEHFTRPFKTYSLDEMWKHSPFCHQACFVRLPVMKAFRYDVTYRIGADHDFFFRAYKQGKVFRYVPVLVAVFDGQDGTTKRRIILAIKEKMAIALKYEYSVFKWIYYQFFLFYINVNHFAKKLLGEKLTSRLVRMIKG